MKKTVLICDICKKEFEPYTFTKTVPIKLNGEDDYYTIIVFPKVTYNLNGSLDWDLCKKCFLEIVNKDD